MKKFIVVVDSWPYCIGAGCTGNRVDGFVELNSASQHEEMNLYV